MRLLPIFIFLISLTCSGCALLIPGTPINVVPSIAHIGYQTTMDERTFSDIASDKDLSLRLKQELMHLRAKDGFFMNIYVYQGRVFLVGDPPEDFKELAVRFAMREEGVVSLDYCFFPQNSGKIFYDFNASVALRTNLILEPGIISSRVDTEIYANQVVLLGVVADKETVDKIVTLAKNTSGINKVINFLIITGKPYTPPPEARLNPTY